MTAIPDFTDAELAIVRAGVATGANSSTIRANNSAPGTSPNDDLRPCVTVRLQVQADHERQPAMTGDGHTH